MMDLNEHAVTTIQSPKPNSTAHVIHHVYA